MLEKDRKKPVRRRAAPKAAPKPAAAETPKAARATAPAATGAAAATSPRATPSTAVAPAAPRATPAPSATPAQHSVSAAERHRMVAEAAYYRARQRGFSPGDVVRDWVEAEAEIDAQLLDRP